MYPYPFPGPEIKNADCLRLAAFDDLDLSAQVTEGNGVSAVFEAYDIAFCTLRILLTDDDSYGIDGKGRIAVCSCRLSFDLKSPVVWLESTVAAGLIQSIVPSLSTPVPFSVP